MFVSAMYSWPNDQSLLILSIKEKDPTCNIKNVPYHA